MPLPNSGVGGTLMTSPGQIAAAAAQRAAAALHQETLFGISPEQLTGAGGSVPAPPVVAPPPAAPRAAAPARPAFGATPASPARQAPPGGGPVGELPIAQRTLAGVMPDDMARAVAAARERAAVAARPVQAHSPAPRPPEPVPVRDPARHDPIHAAQPRPEPRRAEVARSPVPGAPVAQPRTVFEPHRQPDPGTVRSVSDVGRGPRVEPAADDDPPVISGGASPDAQWRTHLGVAIPGIAPIRTNTSAPAPRGGASTAPPAPRAASAPAPRAASAPPPRAATVLEMSGMYQDSLPPPSVSIRPTIPRSALVLLGSGLVLLIAAVAFALLWKGQKMLSVSIAADPTGRDRLDIVCEECPDGTRLTLGPSQAEIIARKAYIALPEPLPLGQSHASFGVQRPGEDEQRIVELTLPPIDYRIVPDIGTLTGDQPRLTLRVAALPGSRVEIAGQAVALDAAGQGESGIDMTAQLLGPASEITTIEQSIPFAITPPSGKLYQGQLAFKIGVTPLQLEAPGVDTVTDLERFMLAGRTSKGAELWVAGTTIPVDEAGRFAQLMSIDSVGETRVTVRATGPGLAPRFASFRLQRVESLSAEASVRQKKARPLSEMARNIADHVGSTVVVSGRIEEVRADGHRTLVILQSTEGCQGRGCLTRLVYGGLRKLTRGENVTAIGRLQGAVGVPGGAGGEVPEIDVSLLL